MPTRHDPRRVQAGSRTLSVPRPIVDAARINAEANDVSMRNYVHGAHNVLTQVLALKPSANTRIKACGGSRHPLPRLALDPQLPKGDLSIVISPVLLEESLDFRVRQDLTISQYIGKTMLFMNGLFDMHAGNPLLLEGIGPRAVEAVIEMPFAADA